MQGDCVIRIPAGVRTVALALPAAGFLHLALAGGAQAQSGLEEAVETARVAWLSHEYDALLASSDTVRLQLPEIGRHQGVSPAHAARVLKEYLEPSDEVSLELHRILEASEDHAYAQLVRRYVVRGTLDERIETVFFGFRWVDGRWRLREVRVSP